MPNNEGKSSAIIYKKPLTIAVNGEVSAGQYISDNVSSEQPLQIILHCYDKKRQHWQNKSLAVVMRTPSDDKMLVIGYLVTQTVITNISDIIGLSQVEQNIVEVTLAEHCQVDWQQMARTFASHSGCGICGKSAMKQLALTYSALPVQSAWLNTKEILAMPTLLKQQQPQFEITGGCHGAALWKKGNLQIIAEDIGRHNAVDKVIGYALQANVKLSQSVLVLSSRISFELVQKAVVAKIPVIVAVGAPSDLAITTAQQFNISIIGFTKGNTANLYCDNGHILVKNINVE